MVSLDPTTAREQFGYRPVLIVTPREFNIRTKLPLISPITSGGDFALRSGFAVELVGTRTTGTVRCDQPRVLDIRQRGGRFIEIAPDSVLLPVLGILRSILTQEAS